MGHSMYQQIQVHWNGEKTIIFWKSRSKLWGSWLSFSVSWLAALLILLPSGVYHPVKGNCLIAIFVILPVYVRVKAYLLSPLSVPCLRQLYPSIWSIYLAIYFLLVVIISYYKKMTFGLQKLYCYYSYQCLGTHRLGRKLRLFQPLFFSQAASPPSPAQEPAPSTPPCSRLQCQSLCW